MCFRIVLRCMPIVLGILLVSPVESEEIIEVSPANLVEPSKAKANQRWLSSGQYEALQQVQAEGQTRVRTLGERYRTMSPGPEREALAREIAQLKLRYRDQLRRLGAQFEPDGLPTSGTAAWLTDGTPVCTMTGYQVDPVIAPDGSGGAYIAWEDRRSSFQIFVQRVTADGNVAPGWPLQGLVVTTPFVDWQIDPSIASDGAGGVLVAWSQRDPIYGDWDIYVQRITSSATVASGWPAGGVAVGWAAGDQDFPAVISDGAGGAIVVWWDYRYLDLGIHAGRVTGAGAEPWTGNGEWVTTTASVIGVPPSICTDGQGGVYIAWEGQQSASFSNVLVQRLDSDGNLPTGWISGGVQPCPTMTSSQRLPDIVEDGYGGAIVAWEDDRSGSTSDFDIYATRLNSDATIASGWDPAGDPVTSQVGSNQLGPRLATNGNEGAIVVWNDFRHTIPYLFVQNVRYNGEMQWTPGNDGVRVSFKTEQQQYQNICSDGLGGVIVVWESYAIGNNDIYAQHIVANGSYAYSINGISLCTETTSQNLPVVALVDDQRAIAAWADLRGGATTGSDIYARNIIGLSNLAGDVTFPGWDAPVVPRNAPDATSGHCVVSPTLDGNSNSTWVSWSMLHEGPYAMPPMECDVVLDDYGSVINSAIGDGLVPGAYVGMNIGPILIAGGRHTLINVVGRGVRDADPDDNYWLGQWVWSPLALTREIPVVRGRPPGQGIMFERDCDGFAFERPPGVAWVTAMASHHPDDDYDLIVYDDYVGSTSGYSNEIAHSYRPDNSTEFVVGHFDGTPTTIFPGVVSSGSYQEEHFIADWTDATYRQGGHEGAYHHQVMELGRLADVYEFALTGGQTYYFVLQRLYGESDIAFDVFPAIPGLVAGRGWHPAGQSLVLTADVDTLAYTTTTSGYHPVVVYRDNGWDAGGTEVVYSLIWNSVPVVDVPEGETPGYELSFQGVTPNPLVGSGQVRFTLAERGEVQLTVYDLRGRRVGTLLDEIREPGPHSVAWNGRGAGIYWLRLETGGQVITKRAVILN